MRIGRTPESVGKPMGTETRLVCEEYEIGAQNGGDPYIPPGDFNRDHPWSNKQCTLWLVDGAADSGVPGGVRKNFHIWSG